MKAKRQRVCYSSICTVSKKIQSKPVCCPGRQKGGQFERGQQQKWDDERSKMDVTARRSSRAQRRMERAEARSAAAPVREDIFEVGDEGMPVQVTRMSLTLL